MEEMAPYLDVDNKKLISREQLQHICDEYTREIVAVDKSFLNLIISLKSKRKDYKDFIKLRKIISKDIHTFESLLEKKVLMNLIS